MAVFIDEVPPPVRLLKKPDQGQDCWTGRRSTGRKPGGLLAFWPDGGKDFSLIFVDPPYRQGLVEPVLKLIDQCNIVVQKGLVIVETAATEQLPVRRWPIDAIFVSTDYGDTKISL